MKKLLFSLAVVVGMTSLALGITCPAGQHSQCTSGSGRGGGYRTTCTCVDDTCSFGFQTVKVGGTIWSYTTQQAYVPDDCSNYLLGSQCVARNTLNPAPGFVVCNNIYPGDE